MTNFEIDKDFQLYNRWKIEISNKKHEDEAELLFIGDMALANRIIDVIDKEGYEYPFELIPDEFFKTDYLIFDLEGCLSERGETWEPKPIHLRGREKYLNIFSKYNDINKIATVANNHFLDYGETAAIDTITSLHKHGIQSFGYEGNKFEPQPHIIQTKDTKIGLISFSSVAHPLNSNIIDIGDSSNNKVIEAIRNVRDKVDILIVIFHHGVEFSPCIDKQSRKLALDSSMAGADVVIAHHAHVVQGIETNGKLIFHGIGNFLEDMDLDDSPLSAYTLAIRIIVSDGNISRIYIEPFKMNDTWQPEPLEKHDFVFLDKYIRNLSKLLTSNAGIMINDIRAFSVWFSSNITSVFEMIKREGVFSTAKYYQKRLVVKLASNSK